jgi:hypothetical protein
MKENPLLKLQTFGQSIRMDYIRRHMMTSGELKQLIEEDGLRGVTSNPSIFEKAIAGSHDYDDASVPGTAYSFGTFKRAQALGDLKALQEHGRRVMRVHLGKDVIRGLDALSQILEQAIGKKKRVRKKKIGPFND